MVLETKMTMNANLMSACSAYLSVTRFSQRNLAGDAGVGLMEVGSSHYNKSLVKPGWDSNSCLLLRTGRPRHRQRLGIENLH